MIGINGIVTPSAITDLHFRIARMNEDISVRGSASSGKIFQWSDFNIGLGGPAVNQICFDRKSPCEHILLNFEGALFNRSELTREIRAKAAHLNSDDLRVVEHYVSEYGIEKFLDRADGAFNIVALDARTMTLHLARDRMGTKPLFYFLDTQKLVFSSKISSILKSGLVEAELQEGAIDQYLGYRYVREPLTFFKGIFQIEAGELFSVRVGDAPRFDYYWQLPEAFNFHDVYDEGSILTDFNAVLRDAVHKRCADDEAIGAYLSGGVDSSIITAIAAEKTDKPIFTYSAGFADSNEFAYAKMVSRLYKTCHRDVVFDVRTYINHIDSAISNKDAPLAVPNEILLNLLTGELEPDIKIMLSGEGADELMGGYGRIFRLPFDYLNHDLEETFFDSFIAQYEYTPRELRTRFLSEVTPTQRIFDQELRMALLETDYRESIFRFFHNYHAKALVGRVHSATAFGNVSARMPFLDYKLIEYAYTKIPYDLKLRWKSEAAKEKARKLTARDYSEVLDTPKYLLRELAYQYLPSEIVDRKKVGFPVPLNDMWDLLEMQARELLPNASWLEPGCVDNLIDSIRKTPHRGQLLWMFINVELFHRKYFTQSWIY